jgi:hypothetical protein
MKKALIPALLVAYAAFAPRVQQLVAPTPSTIDIARAAANPLVWQLWDEFLTYEVASGTKAPSDNGEASKWQQQVHGHSLFCLVFHVLVDRGLDGSLSVSQKNNDAAVSISRAFVRLIFEGQISAHS